MDKASFDRLVSQTQEIGRSGPPVYVEKLIRPGKPRVRRDATFPSRNFHFTPEEQFPLQGWEKNKREIDGLYEMAWAWSRRDYLFEDFDESYGIKHRSLFGAIRHNGELVGAVELEEYQCTFDLARHSFFLVLDNLSFEAATFGGIIAALFTEDEFDFLVEHGTILYWKSAWMRPDHARGAVWAKLTNRIIDRMRGWAILVLKAFPLEYQDGGSAKGFQQRQNAMQRYYEKLIGVEPIIRKRSRYHGVGVIHYAHPRPKLPEEGWMLCWNPKCFDVVGDRVIYPVRYGLQNAKNG